VKLSWAFVDKISEVWEHTRDGEFPNYEAGSMGPKAGDNLLAKDGFYWWPIANLDVDQC
jgi:glucose-6-phosphate 1-dehydrogenase